MTAGIEISKVDLLGASPKLSASKYLVTLVTLLASRGWWDFDGSRHDLCYWRSIGLFMGIFFLMGFLKQRKKPELDDA